MPMPTEGSAFQPTRWKAEPFFVDVHHLEAPLNLSSGSQ